jgi:hypothetical protein
MPSSSWQSEGIESGRRPVAIAATSTGGAQMRFPWLKDVLTENPPFLTVYVDTTRKGASSGPELTTRWEHLRESA